MILSQLINPEDLARLDISQVNTLSAVLYSHILASDEIKKSLQQPVQDALSRIKKVDQRFAGSTGTSSTKKTS
jgi:aspartate/tyrosine/aromatic aminotransferase